MAIALVASSANATPTITSSNTSTSWNPGVTTTVGNLYIASEVVLATVSAPSVSDNSTQTGAANTWNTSLITNSGISIIFSYCYMTRAILSTDLISVSWTTAGVKFNMHSEWSGVPVGGPTSNVTNTGTGTSQNTSALTASSSSGDLVLGLFAYASAVAYTVGADGQGHTMTALNQPTPSLGVAGLTEYFVEGAGSTWTPAATVATGTANWAARGVRFAGGAAPANTVAPATTYATKRVGQNATTTDGTWTGTPAPTFTYQWKRADDNAGTNAVNATGAGATTNTYTTNNLDYGKYLACAVTGTNASGNATATGNYLGPTAAGITEPAQDLILQICANEMMTETVTFPVAASFGGQLAEQADQASIVLAHINVAA